MAHESFEDPQTAALMNENLVAIKVDREERPDIDAVYMTATQAMTGQGGWPMTVFMTAGRRAVLLRHLLPARALPAPDTSPSRGPGREERDRITGQGKRIAAALAERAAAPLGRGAQGERQSAAWGTDALRDTLGPALDAAVGSLERDFDEVHGGFGSAPKFPPSMVLEFLLRHHERTGSAAALRMAEATAEAMARGGMYDQLGGGFARYSVDASWVVPHFEKMLYDNALLARVYAHLWRRTGSPNSPAASPRRPATGWSASCARQRVVSRPRSTPTARARRAGSTSGHLAELAEVLGDADAQYAAQVFGVRTAAGTFEQGSSVLQYRRDTDDPERLRGIRSALLTARATRIRPGTRRQDRRRLERPRDRGARGNRPAARPARSGGGRAGRGPAARRTAHKCNEPGRAAGTDLAGRGNRAR